MTARQWTGDQVADSTRLASPHAWLGFLSVSHPSLLAPIRIVSDKADYQWRGQLWQGLPFEPRIVADGENLPRLDIVMQNVDRAIGEALRRTSARARVSLWLLTSREFDLTVLPRVPKAGVSPRPLYSHQGFELQDVDVNALQVTGELVLRDYSQEPFGIEITEDRFPGAFA